MDSVLFLLRRRYVVLLVLLFGALLCAACGARNAPMARADAAPTASPTTAATLTPTVQPTAIPTPTETPLPTPHEDAAGANVESAEAQNAESVTSDDGDTQDTAAGDAAEGITQEPTAIPLIDFTADATDADIQAGVDVYLANYCGLCHTLTVAGTKGVFGPQHDHIGTIAAERIADPAYTGRAGTPAEYLYESLVDPRAYVFAEYKLTRHPMPAFSHLSEADLRALVVMLLAQQ